MNTSLQRSATVPRISDIRAVVGVGNYLPRPTDRPALVPRPRYRNLWIEAVTIIILGAVLVVCADAMAGALDAPPHLGAPSTGVAAK